MTRLTPIPPPDHTPPVAARRLILPSGIQPFLPGRRSLKPFPGIDKQNHHLMIGEVNIYRFKKTKDTSFQTYPAILAGKG